MKRLRIDRFLLILGAFCFLITGTYRAWHWSYDFISVYCGTRCLLHGCNPYDMSSIQQQYILSGGADPHFESPDWRHSQPPVYPPSTFVALIPFAWIRLPAALNLWIIANALLFTAAVLYYISSFSEAYRWLANIFGAFFLGVSPGTLHWGNPALLALALIVFSCALYRRKRMPVLASCFLCLSLALKPQIGGLVALFLLVDRAHRRSVAAAIGTSVVLLLVGAGVLQLNSQSEHWFADMRANVASSFSPGEVNDPTSPFGYEVNVEPAVAVISSGPITTKVITYGVLAVLAASLCYCVVRFQPGFKLNGLLFAAILVFSMILVYHRRTDVPLLLLTLPALASIFAQRKALAVTAIFLTLLAGFSIESPINPWLMAHHSNLLQSILEHKILFLLLLRQQNLALIMLFCLYLVAIRTMAFRHGIANHEPYPAAA